MHRAADKMKMKYDDNLMLTVHPDGPHKSGLVRSCFEISAQITPKLVMASLRTLLQPQRPRNNLRRPLRQTSKARQRQGKSRLFASRRRWLPSSRRTVAKIDARRA
jgi:hypothetical protein